MFLNLDNASDNGCRSKENNTMDTEHMDMVNEHTEAMPATH